jgi:hypothetical protein
MSAYTCFSDDTVGFMNYTNSIIVNKLTEYTYDVSIEFSYYPLSEEYISPRFCEFWCSKFSPKEIAEQISEKLGTITDARWKDDIWLHFKLDTTTSEYKPDVERTIAWILQEEWHFNETPFWTINEFEFNTVINEIDEYFDNFACGCIDVCKCGYMGDTDMDWMH